MKVTPGSTDVTTYVSMVLSADGSDATGLTITDLDLQYVRSGASPAAKVDATALAATNSAHGDNQAIEVDSTDQPGLYRVDWPDAAFAAGVREVILTVKHADCRAAHLRVEIETIQTGDSYAIVSSGTHGNAALKTLIDDVEGKVDDLESRLGTPSDLGSGATVAANLVDIEALADNLPAIESKIDTIDGIVDDILTDTGTTLQGELDGIQTDTEDIQSRLPAALTAGGNIKAESLVISNNAVSAAALAADAVTEIVTAVLTTAVTEAYRSGSVAPTVAQALCEILQHLGESSISTTTKTLKKFDQSTTAKTYTLDDATTPTAIEVTT